MLHQMVFKLSKEDKAFWNTFVQQMHCKDVTEFVRKLTIVMKTTPVSDFREWFYTRLSKAEAEPNAPISRIFRTIFDYALKDGAVEIQISPQRFDEHMIVQAEGKPLEIHPHGGVAVSVLYRVSDEPYEQMRLPLYCMEPLLSLIKSRADLKISQHDRPQIGAMSIENGSKSYSWQVNTIPTEFGEKITLHLAE